MLAARGGLVCWVMVWYTGGADTERVSTALAMSPERVLRIAGYLPPVAEERLREFEHVVEMVTPLLDGPIRENAMAAIEAVARDARRRAWKGE